LVPQSSKYWTTVNTSTYLPGKRDSYGGGKSLSWVMVIEELSWESGGADGAG